MSLTMLQMDEHPHTCSYKGCINPGGQALSTGKTRTWLCRFHAFRERYADTTIDPKRVTYEEDYYDWRTPMMRDWWKRNGVKREPNETPREFALRLQALMGSLLNKLAAKTKEAA